MKWISVYQKFRPAAAGRGSCASVHSGLEGTNHLPPVELALAFKKKKHRAEGKKVETPAPPTVFPPR